MALCAPTTTTCQLRELLASGPPCRTAEIRHCWRIRRGLVQGGAWWGRVRASPHHRGEGGPMSLQPHAIGPVPDETARIARAVFPRGAPYLHLRDVLGSVYADEDFADLFPRRGQAAEAPWRLA